MKRTITLLLMLWIAGYMNHAQAQYVQTFDAQAEIPEEMVFIPGASGSNPRIENGRFMFDVTTLQVGEDYVGVRLNLDLPISELPADDAEKILSFTLFAGEEVTTHARGYLVVDGAIFGGWTGGSTGMQGWWSQVLLPNKGLTVNLNIGTMLKHPDIVAGATANSKISYFIIDFGGGDPLATSIAIDKIKVATNYEQTFDPDVPGEISFIEGASGSNPRISDGKFMFDVTTLQVGEEYVGFKINLDMPISALPDNDAEKLISVKIVASEEVTSHVRGYVVVDETILGGWTGGSTGMQGWWSQVLSPNPKIVNLNVGTMLKHPDIVAGANANSRITSFIIDFGGGDPLAVTLGIDSIYINAKSVIVDSKPIMPNPMVNATIRSNRIMVNGLSDGDRSAVTVVDMIGRIISNEVYHTSSAEISLEGVPSGVYIVVVKDARNLSTFKLLHTNRY